MKVHSKTTAGLLIRGFIALGAVHACSSNESTADRPGTAGSGGIGGSGVAGSGKPATGGGLAGSGVADAGGAAGQGGEAGTGGGSTCPSGTYLCGGHCVLPDDQACAGKAVSFGPYVFSPTPTELGQTEGEGVWYADTVLLDLDGDGVLDWAAITSPATIATVPCTLAAMRGHGDGTFGPDLLWKITEGGACRLVFTADLSGKGNPSIILQSGGSYITHIVSGGQGIPYTEGTGLSTYGFWPADLTGDGRPELICMVPMDDHFYGFTVAVNDGQGNLSVPDPTAVPPPASFTMQSESAVAVSFDDPSKKEVVLLSNLTSTLIVGYQDSKLTLAQTSLPPGFIAAAKVLGNGRSQLFARSGAMYDPSPDVSIVTQVATFPPLLFDADNLDFGDVDGDGRTDVLWTSSDSGQTVVFRQNVDATFSQVWAGKGYTRFADVNGDGLPDLVQRQNNVAAALNTTK